MRLESRVVAPPWLAQSFYARMRNLHPELTVDGKKVVMDTPAIAAVPDTLSGPW